MSHYYESKFPGKLPKGKKGHSAPLKGLTSAQAVNWIERNCADCPFRNVIKATTKALQGELEAFKQSPEYLNHICLYPGMVKNNGGWCWVK